MGNKLEKMRFSELIKMFGAPRELGNIEGAFKCTTEPSKRDAFYDTIGELIQHPEYDVNKFLSIFDENEELFDKEIFLFFGLILFGNSIHVLSLFIFCFSKYQNIY